MQMGLSVGEKWEVYKEAYMKSALTLERVTGQLICSSFPGFLKETPGDCVLQPSCTNYPWEINSNPHERHIWGTETESWSLEPENNMEKLSEGVQNSGQVNKYQGLEPGCLSSGQFSSCAPRSLLSSASIQPLLCTPWSGPLLLWELLIGVSTIC